LPKLSISTRTEAVRNFETLSEQLFADLCSREGYSPTKIPTDGKPSADFRVLTPLGCLLAEVKELTPNKEERELIRQTEKGEIVAYGGTIGSRAHREIRRASEQLGMYRDEKLPSLVVLYSNITQSCNNLHLEYVDIDVAMNGQWVTWVSRPDGGPRPPDFNGGKRALTDWSGRHVSAVMVISNLNHERAYIYHNAHATTPLPVGTFVGENCFHYKKPGMPQETPTKWVVFRNQEDEVSRDASTVV
jgi:hypothetical protein